MKVTQAYRFALDPTPAQERALRSHAGAARFAWNWGLARCMERYAAERRWYSAAELHRLWNAVKKADPALAWWGENSKCAYQEAFRDLDRALRDFIRSKKGERKGRRLGFPRFKKRGRCRDSFRSAPGRCAAREHGHPAPARDDPDPRVDAEAGPAAGGRHRPDPVGYRVADRAALVRVVHRRGRAGRPERHARPGTAIGIDLGVKTLLTGVDDAGTVITVPGPEAAAGRAAPAAAGLPRARPQAAGSAGRRKAAARLARLHARVANVRADALHKATSMLAARYETIVVEDLNVAGMTRNRRLARAVADQGFGRPGGCSATRPLGTAGR